jgi:hypothetical protein
VISCQQAGVSKRAAYRLLPSCCVRVSGDSVGPRDRMALYGRLFEEILRTRVMYCSEMGIACNIKGTGRLLRVVAGVVLLTDGVMLWHYRLPGNGLASHLLQGLLMAAGGFCLFEGIVGWCAMRALGIRTKL